MKNMEAIAENTAENFIRKHFVNLDHRDSLLVIMKDSVRELIREALEAYELQRNDG